MRRLVALAVALNVAAAGAVVVARADHPPSPPARVTVAVEAIAPTSTTATTAPPTTTTTTVPPTSTTATAPQPPPPPPVGDVQAAIMQAFGPEVYPAALRVARCESGLNPRASEHGTHVGLFQLSTRYHQPRADRLGFTWQQVSTEAWPNAAVAADLYREQGWRPWTCKP